MFVLHHWCTISQGVIYLSFSRFPSLISSFHEGIRGNLLLHHMVEYTPDQPICRSSLHRSRRFSRSTSTWGTHFAFRGDVVAVTMNPAKYGGRLRIVLLWPGARWVAWSLTPERWLTTRALKLSTIGHSAFLHCMDCEIEDTIWGTSGKRTYTSKVLMMSLSNDIITIMTIMTINSQLLLNSR